MDQLRGSLPIERSSIYPLKAGFAAHLREVSKVPILLQKSANEGAKPARGVMALSVAAPRSRGVTASTHWY